MIELTNLRNETSKTFDLEGRKRSCEISIGAVHYKDDYADPIEQWKDIDLTWEGNRITKAPYELTVEGQKITVRDKKTGNVSTVELLSSKPLGMKWEIVPANTSISFRHALSPDKVPFEAQFRVTGKIPLITRAFDDEGELELEASLVDGILTEKLSVIRDRLTGEVRPTKGNIRIDTSLTVQPSAKDNVLSEISPTTNYGSLTQINVRQSYGAHGSINRSIAEFDISSLPGSITISAATLGLYYYSFSDDPGFYTDPIGKTVWAYKLTRTDWVELESTWNIYKTGSNWTTPGGDFNATVIDSIVLDVAREESYRNWVLMGTGGSGTPLTLDWEDEVHLWFHDNTDTGDEALAFNSKEAAANKPYLEITYEAVAVDTGSMFNVF